MDVMVVQQFPLTRIEIARADNCDRLRVDFWRPAANLHKTLMPQANERGQDHAVDIARGRCLVCIKISMCINPEHAYITLHTRYPADGAQRDAMVSSQNQG